MQRYPEALAACDKALKIKPDYYNAWWSKGYALDELQRYQEALSAYDQALKIKPDFSEVWSNRGATLNHLQRYQEALTTYDKTLKIKPNSPEAIIEALPSIAYSATKKHLARMTKHLKLTQVIPKLEIIGVWC